jgi:hypothetical protein
LQFIEFTTKLVTNVAQIYASKTGETGRNASLASVIHDLDSLISSVQKRSGELSNVDEPGVTDRILLDSCQQCLEINQELRATLDVVKADKTMNSTGKAFKEAFNAAMRSLASGPRMSKLVKDLDQIKSQINMAVLVSSW